MNQLLETPVETTPQLTPAQVKKIITRGYAVHGKMATLKRELDDIKTALKEHAVSHPEEWQELEDARRAGEQWIGRGKACECRVVFPATKLDATFDATGPEAKALRKLTGDLFDGLFETVEHITPKVDRTTFQETVNDVLPAKVSAKVLDLCLKDSEPRVTWHGIEHKGRV
jgi:hypothetical protein